MPVIAKVTVDQPRLLCQQSTLCRCELHNDTRAELRGVNPGNWPGAPTIVLNDLARGTVTQHARKQRETPDQFAPSLAAGKRFEDAFALTDVVDVPAPGVYDLHAQYEWNGGADRVVSSPLRIEFLPANPVNIQTVSMRGSPGPSAASVWVNRTAGDERTFPIWLSRIATVLKPRIRDCVHLADAPRLVEPCLSIPPNAPATFIWCAWIDDAGLQYVLHGNGEVSLPESVKLPRPDYRIVPPLIEIPPSRGSPASRLDALLFRGDAADSSWSLRRATIRISGGAVEQKETEFQGRPPRWVQSAHLSDGRRRTFFLLPEPGGLSLKVCRWSPLKAPDALVELAAFDGRLLAATLTQTVEDTICGAALFDLSEGEFPYVIRRWYTLPNDEFGLQEDRCIRWPTREPIDRAVLRIAADSAPFALLRAGGREPRWRFGRNDGSVTSLPDGVRAPVDVLFRYGEDPTVLHVEPGRGLRFVRP